MCRTLLNADEKCKADEFDCEDGSCIKEELKCDGAVNCRFRTDEENCDVSTTLSRVCAINL
jgi:Low-density lipoprotein receptor domain class A